MKKLFSLIFFLWTSVVYSATVPSTGFFTKANCATIPNPAVNSATCLQTTTTGSGPTLRIAGGIYVWNGSAWANPPNVAGGGVQAGPITTSGLTQATGKLLGRGTAGTGAIEEITVGTNLSLSGTTLNASAGAGGYATIQEEGSDLTQRSKLNFIGSAVTCVDDAGNTRTNCTVTSGGGSTHENYLVADIIQARSLVNHAAGNFTTGVIFAAVSDATITGFKFAYDGFASKTVKWTLYDNGYDGTGSTVVETNTQAVAAAQVYAITLSTPKALEEGKYYTISLYINDGSNLIIYTTYLAGWRNFVLGTGGPQTENTVGPVKWNDVAAFASGDAKPVQGNGTNAAPIQLTYQ